MPIPRIRVLASPRLGLSAIAAMLSPMVLIVPGYASPAHADDTIPTVVVTPDLVPTDISKIGSDVSVITRAQIESSHAVSVVDLLGGLPGVGVSESGGLGSVATVSLRGDESQHTLVLIDGVRVNAPSDARESFDFSVLTLENIERIEILRGPQSALY